MTNQHAINLVFMLMLVGYLLYALQPKADIVSIKSPVETSTEKEQCAVLSNGQRYNGALCTVSKATRNQY